MRLTIGSQPLRGNDGTINVRGRRQIALEWGQMNAELLLTMDLYSDTGAHIARLRRNDWTFNDKDRFKFTSDTAGFNLVDTESSQVVLGARVAGRDSVVITHGSFYSGAGEGIEIMMEDWSGAPSAPVSAGAARQSATGPAGDLASIRESRF